MNAAVAAPSSRPRASLFLVSAAFCVIVVGLAAGSLRIGAAVALVLLGVAWLVAKPVLEWRGLAVGLLLIILFIPIRRYVLPGGMPFQLEPYRVYVMLLVGGWALSLLADTRVKAVRTGFEGPLLLLVAATVASELANPTRVSSLATPVLKSLTFFVSFVLVVYVLTSVVRTLADVEVLVRVLVLGGALVCLLAIVESRTGFDVFDHLGRVLPFLKSTGVTELGRGGHGRAFGPAQHPIALGAAMTMLVPLAAYIAATSRSRAWVVTAGLLVIGSFATVSRTSIVMLGVVLVCFLWLHPREMRRLWPLVIPVLLAAHFVLPGTLGTFKEYFLPTGGILQQQTLTQSHIHVVVDPNDPVSCDVAPRLARVEPILGLVRQKPLFGWGYGTRITEGPGANACLLDDQWLGTLLETGVVGLFAWWWLMLSFVVKAMRVARQDDSKRGWLLGALATSVASISVGMFFFDTFSFIQVTLFLFMFLAFGAVALRSTEDPQRDSPAPVGSPAPVHV